MTLESAAIRTIQWGNHQAVPDDEPASYSFIDFIGEPVFPTTTQEKIEMETQRTDGCSGVALQGNKPGGLSFKSYLRGGAGNSGAGGGSPTITADAGEVGNPLYCLFGGSPSYYSGLAASGSGHDSDTIYLSSAAQFPALSGVMVDSDSTGSTRFEAREVISVGASPVAINLDRALQGVPANSAKLYSSYNFFYTPTSLTHSHGKMKIEGDAWRRDLIGCAVKAKINLPASGVISIDWDVMPNTWADVAEANPTYVSPCHASVQPIQAPGSIFWLGSTNTELIEATIDLGYEPAPHVAVQGTNGFYGWIYQPRDPIIAGKIYRTDAEVSTMQGANTYDIGIQMGAPSTSNLYANCVYIRMPAVEMLTVEPDKLNGADIISFTGRCRRSGTSPLRMHIFASAT